MNIAKEPMNKRYFWMTDKDFGERKKMRKLFRENPKWQFVSMEDIKPEEKK